MPSPHQPDILILGAGPAGTVAAITLARAGRRVTILERDPAPKHKVCGEFLSAEALHLLAALNLHPETHDAHPIRTVRLSSAHHLTESPLPFPARSLTRRCLDTLLRNAAESAGAHTLRNAAVESLTQTPQGHWQATLADGTPITAPTAILATGKHDLRGFPRPPGRQNDLVALKMYFQLAPAQAAALQHTVELHLHPYSYTGLQPVEPQPTEALVPHPSSQATGGPATPSLTTNLAPTANLTALVRRHHLTALGGWPGLLADLQRHNPHAAQRLAGATPLLTKPLALSAIPYGFVRRHALAPTLYAVGDQAAVIPSFTGDGMSIALFTGLRAAQAILANEPATAFQPALHAQLRHQVARATALSQALIHPTTSRVLTTAAHLWPASLRHTATLTRLSQEALSSF